MRQKTQKELGGMYIRCLQWEGGTPKADVVREVA